MTDSAIKDDQHQIRRRCFVTGASGMVGLNLLQALVQEGWEVHALIRQGSKRAAIIVNLPLLSHDSKSNGRIILTYGDFQGATAEQLASLIPEHTQVIYHLCLLKESTVHPGRIMTAPGYSPEGRTEHVRLNTSSMTNLLSGPTQERTVLEEEEEDNNNNNNNATTTTTTTIVCRANVPYPLGLPAVICPWLFRRQRQPVPYFVSKYGCEQLLRDAIKAGRIPEGVILQPASIFGPFNAGGWGSFFLRMAQGVVLPGLPGSSSCVDSRDLAQAFVRAADRGPGQGEAYLLGGTNVTNLQLLRTMAGLVGDKALAQAPTRAAPAWMLLAMSQWNETILQYCPSWLYWLRVKPQSLGCPFLVRKLIQDQTANCQKAQQVLDYQPRPLVEMLQANYVWLQEQGHL